MKLNLQPGRYLIALSGGADSVALLRSMCKTAADITALHCNFQLRGEEADRDQRFVAQLCQQLRIPLIVRQFNTREYARLHGISVEMAARELRYQWFKLLRQRLGADYIAVAHHRDDQAETILLNMLRGTGLRGLTGMRRQNGHIVRPLLNVTRQDILKYLAEIGQDYVTDSTNLERDALRNRIRLDVIPLLREINPRAVEHIARTAEFLQDVERRIQKRTEHKILDSESSLYELHEMLHPLGFTSAQEKAIWDGRNGSSGAVFESPTHRLLRDRGRLILEEKKQDDTPPIWHERLVETDTPLDFLHQQPLTPSYAYLDADRLTQPLVARHPQTGDRFCPFGMRGSRLVSDFLTDQKISLFDKQRQWLLCSGPDIVWLLGVRTDNRYRITPQTRHILCLSVDKIPGR